MKAVIGIVSVRDNLTEELQQTIEAQAEKLKVNFLFLEYDQGVFKLNNEEVAIIRYRSAGAVIKFKYYGKLVSRLDLVILNTSEDLGGYFGSLGIPYCGLDSGQYHWISDREYFKLILKKLDLEVLKGKVIKLEKLISSSEEIHKVASKLGYPLNDGENIYNDETELDAGLEKIAIKQRLVLLQPELKGERYQLGYLGSEDNYYFSKIDNNEVNDKLKFVALKVIEEFKLEGYFLFSFLIENNKVYLENIDPAPKDFAQTLWAHSDVPLETLIAQLIRIAQKKF